MRQEEALLKPVHEVYDNPDAFKLVFEGGNEVPVKQWHHQIGLLASGLQILVRPVATTEELIGIDLIGKRVVAEDKVVNSVRLFSDGSYQVFWSYDDDDKYVAYGVDEKVEVYL